MIMDLEARVHEQVLGRRQVLRALALGLGAAVAGSVLPSGLWVPEAYAKDTEEVQQPDLYKLLFSRSLGQRDLATEGMFSKV